MNSVKRAEQYSLYVTLALTLLLSCQNPNVLLHEFDAVDSENWNISDAKHFEIDSVPASGHYETTLEFRTNANYPYRNISIQMTQSLRNRNKDITKTLAYDIVDKNGKNNGEGITYFTHQLPFCTMDIQQGDTVDISIRHNMQDNILPGITDVGVLIEKY